MALMIFTAIFIRNNYQSTEQMDVNCERTLETKHNPLYLIRLSHVKARERRSSVLIVFALLFSLLQLKPAVAFDEKVLLSTGSTRPILVSQETRRINLNNHTDVREYTFTDLTTLELGQHQDILKNYLLSNDSRSNKTFKEKLTVFRVKGTFNDGKGRIFTLSASNPIIRHIDILVLNQNNRVVEHKKLGLLDRTSIEATESHQSLDITIKNEEQYTVYLYSRSLSTPVMLLELFSSEAFKSYHQVKLIFWGAIIALLLGVAFYNAVIYMVSRSKAFVWYLVFYAIAFIYFSAFHGFGILLWPYSIYQWIGTHILPLSYVLLWILLNFSVKFLQSRKHANQIIGYRYVLDFLLAALFLISISPLFNIALFSLFFSELVVSLFTISIAAIAWRNGFYPARFFILSWSCLIVGALTGLVARLELIPINFFTMYAFFFGAVAELLLLAVALADRIKYAERLSFKYAFTDPRTLQPNLPYFSSHYFHLENSATGANQPAHLLLLKLESIENLTGLLGPKQTKNLYRRLVARINNYLLNSDKVLSYKVANKGRHFMIALPDDMLLFMLKKCDSIECICQEMINQVESPILVDNIESRVSTRVGIADIELSNAVGSKRATVEAIYEAYRKALVALLESSDNEDKVAYYKAEYDEKIRKQLELLSELYSAVDQKEFSIHVQPQYDIDRNIVGGEVLIRWIHPEKGFISPAEFIPLAERSSNIFPITKVVLEKSFSWISKNKESLDSFSLAINLSVHDIYQKELFETIEYLMSTYNVPASFISFEITESAVSEDHDAFLAGLNKLRSMGFKLALDDFGTGYSSMSYLQKIAADKIKIDISFVRDIHKSEINQKIVGSIVQIANAINAQTVAEGIENEEELSIIQRLGVNFIQGYFTGKPVDSEHFIETHMVANTPGKAGALS